ncbi:MAG TPA: acyltransferase domain-containing protein, partial [Acidimicrobiales bacterium]
MRAALADAGLGPGDVDAVEAHGTGTTLGDPIEAQALIATYGQAHAPDRPLWLGSLKSNIGHAQAAAGIGGVIKAVQALRHARLPRTLHVDAPTSHVDWDAAGVRLLTEPRPWPPAGRPRRAAVSSFGISGTNAHLILEQAPQPATGQDAGPGTGQDAGPGAEGMALPVLLSARTAPALREQAARLRAHLHADPAPPLPAVTAALAAGRAHPPHRAAITTPDPAALDDALAALAAGHPHPDLVTGQAHGGKLAITFTGQGTKRAGMGRGLYQALPAFAAALDAACAALDPHLDHPLLEVMFTREDLLRQTRYAQPAIFALQTALYHHLTQAHHLTPHYLAGHSIGQLTAAHLAGVWDLPDAARLVAARGRLMQDATPGGAMISIQATPDEVTPHLHGHQDHVSIAAVNSPATTVIAGDPATARAIAARFAALGRTTRELHTSHAFHSPHMQPALAPFRAIAATLAYHHPATP